MKMEIKLLVIILFTVIGITNAQDYKTGNVNPITER
jgi:hypothetical protein